MAIALQGTPSLYENASATTAVVPYPAGIVSGELLLAHFGCSSSTVPTAVPAGWTEAFTQDGGSNICAGVYYRVADGTETGSVTFTSTGAAGRITGIIERWSGVDTTTPIDATPLGAAAFGLSVTAPSITTVTAAAVLTYTVMVHAATAADITTPAGFTKISGATGTGRRTVAFSISQAAAGASGTQVFDQTSATNLEMLAVVVPLRPSGGAPADPTLTQRWTGIPETNTDTSARVQVKVSTDATSVRLRCSTDAAGTTGVVYGPAVTPSADGDATLTATGLTAGTRYYYRVMMTGTNGEIADTHGTIGRLKTAPAGAGSFSFCFASCASGDDVNAWNAVAARADDMFLQVGDLYYQDGTGTTLANMRSKISQRLTLFPNVFATTNVSHTPSDHDGMNNNSTAGNDATAWTNWNTARSELAPMPASYYAWTWGRVRFVQVDTRSFKSDRTLTDNASKTALGATQKQWLKDQITNATEALIFIVQADPWVGAAVASDDSWFGYTTERTELASHFSASGKNIVMLGGDMHAVAADDGTNAPGGIVVLQGSPMNQTSSIKGGPYTAGPYPAAAGSNVQQYARVSITDTGTNTITMDFVGYSAATNTSRVTYSKNYAVASASTVTPTGIATGNAVGTPTVSSTVTVTPTGIPGSEAIGAPTLSALVTVGPQGIPSGVGVGTPAITSSTQVAPQGIAGAAATGTPSLTMDVTVSPVGVPSAAAVGTPTVSRMDNVKPTGIASAAAVGTPTLSSTVTVGPTGIAPKFAVGTPGISSTSVMRPTGIPTKEFVGQPSLSLAATVSPIGIPSLAAVGTPAITGGGPFQADYEVLITKKRWKGSLG